MCMCGGASFVDGLAKRPLGLHQLIEDAEFSGGLLTSADMLGTQAEAIQGR